MRIRSKSQVTAVRQQHGVVFWQRLKVSVVVMVVSVFHGSAVLGRVLVKIRSTRNRQSTYLESKVQQ